MFDPPIPMPSAVPLSHSLAPPDSAHPRCPTCAYWLSPQDIYCPNCKTIVRPRRAFLPLKGLLFGSSVVAIHFSCYLVDRWGLSLGAGDWLALGQGIMQAVATGVGVGAGVGLGTLGLAERGLGWTLWPRSPQTSLQDDEQKIQQRLAELAQRAEPIVRVQQRAAKITDSQQRDSISQALDRAMGILLTHRDRYRLKLWEIQLIRWYNALQPLIDRWYHHLAAESELLYRNLDSLRDRGETLLHTWETTDLAQTPEGQQHLAQLRQALGHCDRLYQDLIAQQAAQVLQGISHFEPDPQFSTETLAAADQLTTLTALPTLADFVSGLEALEDEYQRLRTEAALGAALPPEDSPHEPPPNQRG